MKASAESRILEIAIRGNINFISKAVEADIVAAPMMLLSALSVGAAVLCRCINSSTAAAEFSCSLLCFWCAVVFFSLLLPRTYFHLCSVRHIVIEKLFWQVNIGSSNSKSYYINVNSTPYKLPAFSLRSRLYSTMGYIAA